jgi:hypothetical protein
MYKYTRVFGAMGMRLAPPPQLISENEYCASVRTML